MTHTSHLTRCAPLAIAATLALVSTPLVAQDAAAPPTVTAQPVITVPEPAPAPPPAPTIVIPQELTQPPAAASPAAQPERAASAPTTARTAPARAPTRTAASPPKPAAVAAPEPAPVAEVPVAQAAPVEQTVLPAPEPIPAAEPAPAAEQSGDIDTTMAAVLGGIAALGLIGIGFAALRRRKPKRYAIPPKTETSRVEPREPIAPPAELPAAAAAEPAFEPAAPVAYSSAAFTQPRPAARSSSGLSHTGASVALPREIPKTVEEREELMQRMVSAAPDRANPFRSQKARAKRARLILASLGRDFADADPWIDLSQYPSNWPALARRQAAAA